MTGNDWLVVAALISFVVFVFVLDGMRRLDDREAERADDERSRQRLMDEIGRQ